MSKQFTAELAGAGRFNARQSAVSGRNHGQAGTAKAARIPRIIHYSWLSGNEKPRFMADCFATWKNVMPDYEFRCWDAAALKTIDARFANQAYRAEQWAFAADYIRLHALYHVGGVYLDADVKVFRRFDEFLHDAAFASIESYTYRKYADYRHDYWIDAAMLGAEKGNPFIKDCLDYYRDRDFVRQDGTLDQQVICHIMADIAETKYGFVRNSASFEKQFLQHDAGVIYPPFVFSHRRGDIRRSTCAIHLYAGSWRQKPVRHRSLLSRVQAIAIACTNEKIWGRLSFKGLAVLYFLRRLLTGK
ncbi:MAG: glycosyltransferase family 32 protein [Kiritimatiellia bacterium]